MSIVIKQADITKIKKIQVLVNAANGVGIMGAGVAGAISRAAGGEDFIKEVRAIAMASGKPHEEGQCYFTPPGLLAANGVKAIAHAVTMKYPGSHSSYAIIDKCLETLFKRLISEKYESVAVPGLGTGIGNLDREQVARRTVEIAKQYDGQLQIHLVDIDPVYIQAAREAVATG